MVPAFLGEHFDIQCADCRFEFAVDATKVPIHGHATCPNCGFTQNPYEGLKAFPSTLIKLALPNDTYQRWDVIAFQFSDTNQNGVKRIVGLPGERIEIRNGNIFVDGKLARRDWALADQMKLTEFDWDPETFPAQQLSNRLIAEGDWYHDEGAFRLKSGGKESSKGRIYYQPIHAYRGSNNRKQSSFVLDNYGYNQTNSRVRMNRVEDLWVETKVNIGSVGLIEINLTRSKSKHLRFRLDASRHQVSIWLGDKELVNTTTNMAFGWQDLTVSSVDGIARLSLNGKLECESEIPIGDDSTNASPKEPVIFITGDQPRKELSNQQIELKSFKVFRDVFYTDRGATDFQLGNDEYLVLGDNSPVSVDSRTWSKPTIHRSQIHGIVVPAGR